MLDSLLVTLIVMFLAWFWKTSQHSKKFPPGPRCPVPVLGDAYVLGDDLEKGFKKLILKHGKICGLWLGPQRTVVVADFEILQEVLNKIEFSDRQHWALENLRQGSSARLVHPLILVNILRGLKYKVHRGRFLTFRTKPSYIGSEFFTRPSVCTLT